MGLGDEIMALGRAEQVFYETGRQVSICSHLETPRDFDIWHGNPAWVHAGGKKMIDGGGARPYIKHWHRRQAVYNLDYRASAGEIHVPEKHYERCALKQPYAIVAPYIMKNASPNKDWGRKNWEAVINDFPIPVFQLCADNKTETIKGALKYHTPEVYDALAAIEGAAVVMACEGGTHHMAASARVPAVVVFGSFVPPQVTGYEFHHNIAVDTEHGYCGNWEPCEVCKESMKQISPETVREKAILILESYDAD